MSARQALGSIARRRLVPPKPQKNYVKWYMKWADKAHKAVVLTCVGVTRKPPLTLNSITLIM
jgi:Cytochrome oxidase c assembly